MVRAQSVVFSVLTTKFLISAGDVIGVAITPGAALKGVAAALLRPDGSPVGVFGEGSLQQGSIYAPKGGKYSAVFGNTAAPGVTTNFTVTVMKSDGVPLLTFSEEPVSQYRGQETVTVYCNSDGSVNVWTATKSVGYFAFAATKDEIAKVPARPHNDTLIKSDLGVAVYRLTTGELQINADNGYVFVWNDYPAL